MKCVVLDMPNNEALRATAAQWSFSEWGKLYPDDSVQWYLDLYAASDHDDHALPVCLAAVNEDGSIVGTASLIENDELPNAPEPGPWVAAVYVAHATWGLTMCISIPSQCQSGTNLWAGKQFVPMTHLVCK
jgi:hypothetical protein